MVILPPKYNDPISILLANNGVYETFITEEIVLKHIKKGQTVIDAGAQIGYYTVLFGKLVGPKGKVYAFEPDSRNFEILAKNIRVNKLKNVKAAKVALADFVGTRQFFTNPMNRGASSFSSPKVGGVLVSDVKVTTLDEFFRQTSANRKIDFLKIDVEGAEHLVLRGATSILEQPKLLMLLELSPCKDKHEGEGLQLLKYLQPLQAFSADCRFDLNLGMDLVTTTFTIGILILMPILHAARRQRYSPPNASHYWKFFTCTFERNLCQNQ